MQSTGDGNGKIKENYSARYI